MKVWVVLAEDWTRTKVVGVFDSKMKADTCVVEGRSDQSRLPWKAYWIAEWELNSFVGLVK